MTEETKPTKRVKKLKGFSNQGLTYCRSGKSPVQLLTKVNVSDGGTHCPKCHYRVRGANHEQGSHHNSK